MINDIIKIILKVNHGIEYPIFIEKHFLIQ